MRAGFANAVRAGMAAAQPVAVDAVTHLRRDLAFGLQQSPLADLKAQLKTKEAFLQEQLLDKAAASTHDQRFELVVITALRQLIAVREGGYAAHIVPLLAAGTEPYLDIQGELTAALTRLSRDLAAVRSHPNAVYHLSRRHRGTEK